MNKLSICILSTDHYPQYLGGIKRVTSILGSEWIRYNCDVCYLTFCSSSFRPNYIKGIPQFYFPNVTDINSDENIVFFINLIQQHQIKIILNPHVEDQELTRLTFKIKKTTNVKLVSVLHFSPNHQLDITRQSFFNKYLLGDNPLKWIRDFILWIRFHLIKGKQIQKQQKLWQSTIIQRSDKFVLLSQHFLKYFNTEELKYITFINDPTDNTIKDVEKKTSKKEKTAVWCGRMDLNGMKRVDRILRIWEKISPSHLDWKLKLLGSGDKKYINKLIQNHSIKNVEVVGFCNAYDYYSKASILTLTSTTEGWGMVLVEAQQFGCVPIAFDSYDSINDIIQNGETGFLIKPFNLNEYAKRLSYIMDHPEVRERISTKAKESVTRFNASCIAQQWIELFNSLL